MTQFQIVQFMARKDNFAVLLHDEDTSATIAIDAPEAAAIQEQLRARGWELTHILVTHKHADHVEGIPALRDAYPGLQVIGPEKSSDLGLYDEVVEDDQRFELAGAEFQVIATPGHTLDHVCYYLPGQQLAFTADTLFALGCGRIFEGTPAMMWDSLQKLRALPDDTAVYCGHEYTLANALFARTVDPDNDALRDRLDEVQRLCEAGEATLPTTIGEEKRLNPYLRPDDPDIRRTLGLEDATDEEVFAEIRARKDRF
ncbi:hydroxyacylglutathione hydrolase [Faunimonas pinastri]|uniref:Hydroxyacylglutathione hydrolase n=1 Tax=Faunimonas pinastri TaxID=1855383 RepID=A0A1H9HU97_9HYPH|nr:hydroxyacylglutathione hydrolase [Faunimonas pinastri]SEQ65886.1 hydroxyacylglutathione hydrolase [Faunimonas pinastri]